MHRSPAPERAAAAALPFACAGHAQRAQLLDALGAALDRVRHRLPRQAAYDAGIAPDVALRQHDVLRGWLHALSGALRAEDGDGTRTVPLGPVAAVGAHGSAYGLAGMHAMAALAAGCPVLARAVPAPSCTELAELVATAATASRLPDDVFALVPDDDALLAHDAVRGAICRGGTPAMPRLLPAVAELDGTEAAFVLPAALNGRAEYLGRQLLAQPGACPIVVAAGGDGFIDLREAIIDGLAANRPTCSPRPDGVPLPASSGAAMLSGDSAPFAEVAGHVLLAQPELARQRQGGLLVRCADGDELLALAWSIGPLACASLHVAPEDAAGAARLMPVLELAARHIHVNRFGGALLPTRLAARDAIGRFRRPVFHHGVSCG